MNIVRYSPDWSSRWDVFVRASKNGTFLFERGFMDYHADRFADCSLVFTDGSEAKRIVALFPANLSSDQAGRILSSHGGLTYGGFVLETATSASDVIAMVEALKGWCKDNCVAKVVYKSIPRCYHKLASDEDQYALFLAGARQVAVELGAVVDMRATVPISKSKRQGAARAHKLGVAVAPSDEIGTFHELLVETLAPKGVSPTHSEAELRLLTSRFPEQILLYGAFDRDVMIAAVLLFRCETCVHLQYMASSASGRSSGGLDIIVERIVAEYSGRCRYLSFGISTEQKGRFLNEGLMRQKEMFGGRAMIQSTFELSI